MSTRDEAEQKAERSRILGRARKELIADTVEGVTETVEVDSKQLECVASLVYPREFYAEPHLARYWWRTCFEHGGFGDMVGNLSRSNIEER